MFYFLSLPTDMYPDNIVFVPVALPGSGCQTAGLIKVKQATWVGVPELRANFFQGCWRPGIRTFHKEGG